MTDNAELIRLLAQRAPGQQLQFVLSSGPAPRLGLARTGSKMPLDATEGISGTVLVGSDFTLVFCAPYDPGAMLAALATWVRQWALRLPAAAALLDAGASRCDPELTGSALATELAGGRLAIRRDPQLWSDLFRPDIARTASVLAACRPGERLWFWMAENPNGDIQPLLVLPVSEDPNRDGMNALIAVAEAGAAEAGAAGAVATGTAHATEDGSLQFLSPAVSADMLNALAAWARCNSGVYPGLGRLVGCRLVRLRRGLAETVIADPSLWSGLVPPTTPASEAESGEILSRLTPGQECWFWLTGKAPGGWFLSLADTAGDPEGADFLARVAGLHRRFPDSHSDALQGILSKSADGGLVFVTARPDRSDWPALRRGLAERFTEAAPALAAAELRASGPARGER